MRFKSKFELKHKFIFEGTFPHPWDAFQIRAGSTYRNVGELHQISELFDHEVSVSKLFCMEMHGNDL